MKNIEYCRLNIDYLRFACGGSIIKNDHKNDRATRGAHATQAPVLRK